jgi:multicomponent Na+:H+ antiporter subunit G
MIDEIAYVIIFLGLFFIITSILGLIRMPDSFAKIHALSISEVLGIPLILIGLALLQNSLFASLKVLLLIPIMLIVGPVSTHYIAKITHNNLQKKEYDEF